MTLALTYGQTAGAKLLAANRAFILGDKPGVGKSAQAIQAAHDVGARRILVICPNVLRENWAREFRLWWPKTSTLMPIFDANCNALPSDKAPCIFVVNFDKFSMKKGDATSYIYGVAWDAIIIDEAHALKSLTSKRTQAVYSTLFQSQIDNEPFWWLLSGTIAPNHPAEMYTHLRRFFPERIPNALGKPQTLVEFEDAYCEVRETVYGRKIVGGKNFDKLRQVLAPVYISRSAESDAPSLRFADFPVDIGPAGNKLLRELALPEDGPAGRIAAAFESGDDDAVLFEINQGLHLATARKVFGVAKAPSVAELVSLELMGNRDKRIVFAHHRDVIDILADRLSSFGARVVDGRTNSSDAQDAVDKFQTDKDTRVFIGQIDKCKEGLTLTASNQVIMAEQSWVPDFNYQCAKRSARRGQTRDVLCRFISASGTVDGLIAATLARKMKTSVALFGSRN